MVKCIDTYYSHSGAKVRIVVYTSSEDLCREVREAVARGVSGIMEFLKRHGGCRVRSKSPLRVESGDGKVSVEVEPASFIASLFWGSIVERVEEVCRRGA